MEYLNKTVAEALQHALTLAMPEVMLIVTACIMFLGGTFYKGRDLWAWFALLGLALGLLALKHSPRGQATIAEIYAAPLFLDNLAILIKAIALAGGAILVLFSWQEVSDELAAEYHGCLLLITAGLCLVGSANELVTLFLALELISIPTYILLYIPKRDMPAQEAATKYFLLSIFSSAFLLFGFSYLYGLTGSTNIATIVRTLQQEGTVLPLALVALVMLVAGLGFKITAVPFHFYAPDVYQGAATPVAALLAFLPKVAGFAALIRLLGFVWIGSATPNGLSLDTGAAFGGQMPLLLWILAAVSMTLGNLLALLQSNVKRLLAYSSVAHAGYMLIGLTVAQDLGAANSPIPGGVQALLFYLIAYGAMTIGAFAVLAYLSTPERPVEMEDDLAGLGTSHPQVALMMTLFLFSLTGMPLTAGFVGKAMLFMGALTVKGDRAWFMAVLALVAAVNAAIGGWYYLRIVAKMYLHSPVKPLDQPRAWPKFLTILICAGLTLFLGIYPQPLVRKTSEAVPRMEDNSAAASNETNLAATPRTK